MLDCKKAEELMMLAAYGHATMTETEQLHNHLDGCEACRQAQADLEATLGIMKQRERRDPGQLFWNGYWDNLVDRLNQETAESTAPAPSFMQRIKSALSLNGWTLRLAAAAAILVLGIHLGRQQSPQTPINSAQQPVVSAEMASLNQRSSHYLQKSKVLLLGLINFDSEEDDTFTLDLKHKQAVSQELLKTAADLKTELKDSPNQKLQRLITDLEVILLQIANLESEHDLDAIDMVRNGVDRRGILLKINLEEMKQTSQSVQPINNPPHAAI